MRVNFMRSPGVIMLFVTIALGIVAIRSYLDDNEKEHRVIAQLALLRADSPLRSSSLQEIGQLDSEERNDEIVGAIATVLLIGSLGMMLRADS